MEEDCFLQALFTSFWELIRKMRDSKYDKNQYTVEPALYDNMQLLNRIFQLKCWFLLHNVPWPFKDQQAYGCLKGEKEKHLNFLFFKWSSHSNICYNIYSSSLKGQ